MYHGLLHLVCVVAVLLFAVGGVGAATVGSTITAQLSLWTRRANSTSGSLFALSAHERHWQFVPIGLPPPTLPTDDNGKVIGGPWLHAVDVHVGRHEGGGWHMEQYHANRTLFDHSAIPGRVEERRVLAYYAVGYADGYVTAQRLWDSFKTNFAFEYNRTMHGQDAGTKVMRKHLMSQLNHVRHLANSPTDRLSRHLKAQLAMLEGRAAGFNQRITTESAPHIQNHPHRLNATALYLFAAVAERSWLARTMALAVAPTASATATKSILGFEMPPPPVPSALCSVVQSENDVHLGWSGLTPYSNMNYSVTTVTLESQVTSIRRQEHIVSADFAVTSSKLAVCQSYGLTPTLAMATRVRDKSYAVGFLTLFALMTSTTAGDFAHKFSNVLITPVVKLVVVDFKKVTIPKTPQRRGGVTLLRTAVVSIDVLGGRHLQARFRTGELNSTTDAQALMVTPLLPDEVIEQETTANGPKSSATSRRRRAQALRAAARNNLTAASDGGSSFELDCRWCNGTALLFREAAENGPQRLVHAAKKHHRLTGAHHVAVLQRNHWKNESSSVVETAQGPVRCGSISLAPRGDLFEDDDDVSNQRHRYLREVCSGGSWGATGFASVSARSWLGPHAADHDIVLSYVFDAALGPTNNGPNHTTPTFRHLHRQPHFPPTMANRYAFATVGFSIDVPEAHRVAASGANNHKQRSNNRPDRRDKDVGGDGEQQQQHVDDIDTDRGALESGGGDAEQLPTTGSAAGDDSAAAGNNEIGGTAPPPTGNSGEDDSNSVAADAGAASTRRWIGCVTICVVLGVLAKMGWQHRADLRAWANMRARRHRGGGGRGGGGAHTAAAARDHDIASALPPGVAHLRSRRHVHAAGHAVGGTSGTAVEIV